MDELSEREFEGHLREMIARELVQNDPNLHVLDFKKAVDIVLCRNGQNPAAFFIEVKYHKKYHSRIGIGHGSGGGFQPEVIDKKYDFFDRHMRWIIGSDDYGIQKFILADNMTIRQYLSGGTIGAKHNNIQLRFLKEAKWLTRPDLVVALRDWVGG